MSKLLIERNLNDEGSLEKLFSSELDKRISKENEYYIYHKENIGKLIYNLSMIEASFSIFHLDIAFNDDLDKVGIYLDNALLGGGLIGELLRSTKRTNGLKKAAEDFEELFLALLDIIKEHTACEEIFAKQIEYYLKRIKLTFALKEMLEETTKYSFYLNLRESTVSLKCPELGVLIRLYQSNNNKLLIKSERMIVLHFKHTEVNEVTLGSFLKHVKLLGALQSQELRKNYEDNYEEATDEYIEKHILIDFVGILRFKKTGFTSIVDDIKSAKSDVDLFEIIYSSQKYSVPQQLFADASESEDNLGFLNVLKTDSGIF